MPTATQPVRTSPTARPAAGRTALAATKTAVTSPEMPGPRMYRLLRVGLVIWTLLTTVICVLGIILEESNQVAIANDLAAAQDLRNLSVQVNKAESDALVYLANPSDTTWTAYQNSGDQVDQLLLSAAASADDPGNLTSVAHAIRQWRDAVVEAHATSTPTDATAKEVTDAFTSMDTALTQTIDQTAGTPPAGTALSIVGVIISSAAVIGFIWAMVLVARRSHRVVNVGLAIGLVAVIGLVTTMGITIGRLGQIVASDSQISTSSQAAANLWEARSNDALAVLQPYNKQSLIDNATHLVNSVNSTVSNSQMSALAKVQTSAASANTANLTALVSNATPWQAAVDSIMTSTSAADPHSLIPDTRWSLAVLSGLCVVAVIATLAGIHTRTQEYR